MKVTSLLHYYESESITMSSKNIIVSQYLMSSLPFLPISNAK